MGENGEISVYVPSGKLTPHGIVMMTTAGVLAAIPIGLVYSAATHYIPLIGVINALFIFGASTALAKIIFYFGKLGKIRNPMLACTVGLISALAMIYCAWAFYVCMVEEFTFEMFYPGVLWEEIGRINETGVWSVKGSTPTGIVLWVLWAAEAIGLVGLTALLVRAEIAGWPFCEQCEKWTLRTPSAAKLELVDKPEMITSAIATGHYEVFDLMTPVNPTLLVKVKAGERQRAQKAIKKAEKAAKKSGDGEALAQAREKNAVPGTRQYINVSTAVCPQCGEDCYATISCVTIAPDDKGNDAESSKDIVTNQRIPRVLLDKIVGIGSGRSVETSTAEPETAPGAESPEA